MRCDKRLRNKNKNNERVIHFSFNLKHLFLYFTQRWKFTVIVIFYITSFCYLPLWFIDKRFLNETRVDWVEPLILFLGLMVSLIVGRGLIQDLRDLEEKSKQLSLEDKEDPTTKPWRLTNHSFFEIKYENETNNNKRSELLRFLCEVSDKFFDKCIIKYWTFTAFQRLIEETGTDNYRVLSPLKEPRFLKIYKDPKKNETKCRNLIAEDLKEKEVFPEYIKYLIPYRHSEIKTGTSFVPNGNVIFELYPYIDGVTHFKGKEEKELINIAGVLGKLQKSLQVGTLNKKLESINLQESDAYTKYLTEKEITEKWKKINCLINTMHYYDPIARVLYEKENQDIIIECVKKVASLRKEQKEKELVLLFDVHPHNVFYKDNECVLIYDYSGIGYWHHSHVLAFSLHRFIREYVRERNYNFYTKEYFTNKIRELANQFIEEYERSYNDSYDKNIKLERPDDFKDNLHIYIMSANMDKLLSVSLNSLKKEDILRRPESRMFGEVRKFIRYMREAKAFKKEDKL